MSATITMICLGLLLLVSVIQFCNELYWRKRVSMLGVIVMFSSVYLMWYLHGLNNDILELAQELSKYQIVKLPKGE